MYQTLSKKDPTVYPLWDMKSTDRAGSFTLVNIPENIAYVPKGTPIHGDEDQGWAYIVKTNKVIAGGSASSTWVEKGTLFAVGDAVAGAVGDTSVSVTSIDYSNQDYDIINHDAFGAALSEGDVMFEASAVGSSASYKYEVTGLLNDDTKNLGDPSCTQVVRSLRVIEGNLPFPLSTEIKELLTDRIRYTKY